jgi:hypothetical protein
MLRPLLPLIGLMVATSASAHPFSKDTYSLASALRLSDRGLMAVVVLEVPVPVVLADVQARVDAGAGKRKALSTHDASRFDGLGAALSLVVNGEPQQVTWRPVENPANGKVAEGFFLYWVGVEVPLETAWGDKVTATLHNTAYPDVKMVYTGSAEARDAWTVASNTATQTLGVDVASLESTDPRAWSDAASLRKITVTWTRAQ